MNIMPIMTLSFFWQSLVDSAFKEADLGDDIGLRNGVLVNGKA